jgi:hypothetical protein
MELSLKRVLLHLSPLFPLDRCVRRFQFHRIIQDECHIGTHTPRYSPLRWGLTGTPVSTSIFDLKRQAQTLGHWTSGLLIRDQISRRGAASSTAFTAETFQTFVESLKRLLMLHTKVRLHCVGINRGAAVLGHVTSGLVCSEFFVKISAVRVHVGLTLLTDIDERNGLAPLE